MALALIKGKALRWYGRVMRNGVRRAVPLDLPVEGSPPASGKLSDKGDAVFERSRARAELRWEQVLKELESPQREEDLLTRIHLLRVGKKVGATVALDEAYAAWLALPRKGGLAERYKGQVCSTWDKFLLHVRAQQPRAVAMRDITVETAEAFMAKIVADGVAPKTYNNVLISLRSIFTRLARKGGMHENPFEGIPERSLETIGHSPFTPEELAAIVLAARKPEHKAVLPVILAGICTAMRLGDCCQLKWSSVDLGGGYIDVKTSKTGGTAAIPLFPLLEQMLRSLGKEDSEFAFPTCAMMYATNPDGIGHRVEKVLRDAGFADAEGDVKLGLRGKLTVERQHGVRRACVRGFHSFRVTWITLALNAGVPMELVRRVTSHSTVEIVLNHYFKPRREDLRRALSEKMPPMFSLRDAVEAGSSTEELLASTVKELEGMSAGDWNERRLGLIRKLKAPRATSTAA